MNITLLVLRLIHVVAGVFWAGTAFSMATHINPAAKASGEAGPKFMAELGIKSSFSVWMGIAATLTFLSGLIMFILFAGTGPLGRGAAWFQTGQGIVLTIGALFGIVGTFHGFFNQKATTDKMKALSTQIAAAGGPPAPEQIAEMQQLAGRMEQYGQASAIILAIAVVCMGTFRYF